MIDTLTYVGVFVLVAFVAWLSNREIKKSRTYTQSAEKILRELIESEQTRIQELERVAQFGELSRGIFHDLLSPLSSLSLYVEHMNSAKIDPHEAEIMVKKAVAASRRMRTYLESVRHSLKHNPAISKIDMGLNAGSRVNESADLTQEMLIVKDLLAYKARMLDVEIHIRNQGVFTFDTQPLYIHQILMNLVANAIESYETSASDSQRIVEMWAGNLTTENSTTENVGEEISLYVLDYGCGIDERIREKIFSPTFSTKKTGTGIGLSTVKRIVEKELGGTITYTSSPDKGTLCVVRFPRHTS